MTRVLPAACSSKTSRRSTRVPTIEPTTVMPLRTVSKIGSSMWFSAGSATKTSVPPRRGGAHGQRDGLVGAAQLANRLDGISPARVHDELRAELVGQLELLVDDVDRDDTPAGDRRVLDGEVAETTDAEHSDEVGRPCARDLDRLVGRDPRAGERRSVDRIDGLGHLDDVAAVRLHVVGEGPVQRVAHVLLLEAERLPAADAVFARSTC